MSKLTATGDLVWGCADGTKIRVKDMSLDHFVNVINWMSNSPMLYAEVLPKFYSYAGDLSFVKFSANERYPVLDPVDLKWKIMDPADGIVRAAPPPREYYEGVAKKYGDEFLFETFGVKL